MCLSTCNILIFVFAANLPLLLSLHLISATSAFVFMDAAGSENRDIPEELKKKYTLSRELGRYVQ